MRGAPPPFYRGVPPPGGGQDRRLSERRASTRSFMVSQMTNDKQVLTASKCWPENRLRSLKRSVFNCGNVRSQSRSTRQSRVFSLRSLKRSVFNCGNVRSQSRSTRQSRVFSLRSLKRSVFNCGNVRSQSRSTRQSWVLCLKNMVILKRILYLLFFMIISWDHDSTSPTSTFTASQFGSCQAHYVSHC